MIVVNASASCFLPPFPAPYGFRCGWCEGHGASVEGVFLLRRWGIFLSVRMDGRPRPSRRELAARVFSPAAVPEFFSRMSAFSCLHRAAHGDSLGADIRVLQVEFWTGNGACHDKRPDELIVHRRCGSCSGHRGASHQGDSGDKQCHTSQKSVEASRQLSCF